jgi:hypothetical protein
MDQLEPEEWPLQFSAAAAGGSRDILFFCVLITFLLHYVMKSCAALMNRTSVLFKVTRVAMSCFVCVCE